MKLSSSSLLFLILTISLTSGCARQFDADEVSTQEKTAVPEAPAVYGIAVKDAEAAECAHGGSVIQIFLDKNVNGAREEAEAVLSSKAICNGANGQDGQNGSNGSNGADGTNGQNGQNGADAVLPGFTIVEPIFPCGNNGNFKEVLLRMQNGQVLASFSDNTAGSMTRLVLIPDGTYMTSDNGSCVFSLTTSNEGHTRSVIWDGQVQKSWDLTL